MCVSLAGTSFLDVGRLNLVFNPFPPSTDSQHPSELWKLYFDGFRSKNGIGGGCMPIYHKDEKYYASFRFSFSCTNNIVGYEALVHDIQQENKWGISCLQVYGDNELIVNQVRSHHTTKNELLKSYKHRICDLIEDFQAFNLLYIPRNLNKHVDRLAVVGENYDIPSDISNMMKQ